MLLYKPEYREGGLIVILGHIDDLRDVVLSSDIYQLRSVPSLAESVVEGTCLRRKIRIIPLAVGDQERRYSRSYVRDRRRVPGILLKPFNRGNIVHSAQRQYTF